jgi:hypothetical protein
MTMVNPFLAFMGSLTFRLLLNQTTNLLTKAKPTAANFISNYVWLKKKEVARGVERTRVLSISFIFSFSPLYR